MQILSIWGMVVNIIQSFLIDGNRWNPRGSFEGWKNGFISAVWINISSRETVIKMGRGSGVERIYSTGRTDEN